VNNPYALTALMLLVWKRLCYFTIMVPLAVQRDNAFSDKIDNMAIPTRSQIQPGLRVRIVEKQNQRSGLLSEGVVRRILTSSPTHPHGIKVMLEDGRVGRVQEIVSASGGLSEGKPA